MIRLLKCIENNCFYLVLLRRKEKVKKKNIECVGKSLHLMFKIFFAFVHFFAVNSVLYLLPFELFKTNLFWGSVIFQQQKRIL